MKKSVKPILLALVAIITFAFSSPIKKQIDIKESTIVWTGKKVLGKSHTGTIDLKEGYLEMEGDVLLGGNFVVDMTTIKNTDMDEGYGKKLVGHLESDDFFGVSDHPTATLVTTHVAPAGNGYNVQADITIKRITKATKFHMVIENGTATTTLKIDRSKHDVKYGSGSFFDNLGDKAIADIIELNVTLKI